MTFYKIKVRTVKPILSPYESWAVMVGPTPEQALELLHRTQAANRLAIQEKTLIEISQQEYWRIHSSCKFWIAAYFNLASLN